MGSAGIVNTASGPVPATSDPLGSKTWWKNR